MTPLPVEFAHKCSGCGGAPTLVPYEGGPVRAQVIVVDTSPVDEADRHFRREINAIGSGKHCKHSDNPGPNKVNIDRLEGQFGLDIELYIRKLLRLLKI